MAKSAKDAGEITNGGSNSAAIKKAIAEAGPEIMRLEDERRAITSEIKEIRDAKVKAHGIKAADFNAMFRIYKLSKSDLDDAAQQANESLTNMQVVAEALGLAIQGGLFGAAAAAGDQAPAGVPIN